MREEILFMSTWNRSVAAGADADWKSVPAAAGGERHSTQLLPEHPNCTLAT